MKNEDLQLGAKATNNNRQHFEGAVAILGEEANVVDIRSKIGIPAGGFSDDEQLRVWLHPDPWVMDIYAVAERHSQVSHAVKFLLAKLRLTENYSAATKYYLLRNEIGHIPGNFSISVIPGSKRLVQNEDGQLMTGEVRLAAKLKSKIHDAIGNKLKRVRKNAERDLKSIKIQKEDDKTKEEYDFATEKKVPLKTTSAILAGKLGENADVPLERLGEADRKSGAKLRKAKERAKKRH